MKRIALLTVVLCCLAAGDEPQSPAARQAERNFEFQMKLATAKRDGAIKRAEQEFEREQAQAQAEYKRRLNDALKLALKAGNLDEANAIKAQMESIGAEREKAERAAIVVKRATFGVRDRVVDGTDIMGRYIDGKRMELVVTSASFGGADPAVGVVKSGVFDLEINGTPVRIIVPGRSDRGDKFSVEVGD